MKWLTNFEDIPNADDESLRYSIITGDGRGKAFKTAILEEIINREVNKRLEHSYGNVNEYIRKQKEIASRDIDLWMSMNQSHFIVTDRKD